MATDPLPTEPTSGEPIVLTPSGEILTLSGDTVSIVPEAPEVPAEAPKVVPQPKPASADPPARSPRTTVAGKAAWNATAVPKVPLTRQQASEKRAELAAAELRRKCQESDVENVRLRSELRQTREGVTTAQRQHEGEIQQASQRESGLDVELASARDELSAALESAIRSRRNWMGFAATIVISSAFLITTLYGQLHKIQSERASGVIKPAVAVSAPVAMPRIVATRLQPTTAMHDFTAALARLDQALSKFGSNNPELVLQRVHQQNAAHGASVCSFEWNNGQPSLMLGTDDSMKLETALGLCAEAVDRSAR